MPKLIAHAKACAIGDPWAEATSFGPLISELQRDKVMAYIASGVAEGAKIATGGKTWGTKGFYVEPTILTDVHAEMKCVREEIFGPVIVVAKFKTEEEVLKIANDSMYGLGAAVFTGKSFFTYLGVLLLVTNFPLLNPSPSFPGDAKQSMRVSGELDAGSVWVNQYGILHSSVRK